MTIWRIPGFIVSRGDEKAEFRADSGERQILWVGPKAEPGSRLQLVIGLPVKDVSAPTGYSVYPPFLEPMEYSCGHEEPDRQWGGFKP